LAKRAHPHSRDRLELVDEREAGAQVERFRRLVRGTGLDDRPSRSRILGERLAQQRRAEPAAKVRWGDDEPFKAAIRSESMSAASTRYASRWSASNSDAADGSERSRRLNSVNEAARSTRAP
jgi:hypothetical protein